MLEFLEEALINFRENKGNKRVAKLEVYLIQYPFPEVILDGGPVRKQSAQKKGGFKSVKSNTTRKGAHSVF